MGKKKYAQSKKKVQKSTFICTFSQGKWCFLQSLVKIFRNRNSKWKWTYFCKKFTEKLTGTNKSMKLIKSSDTTAMVKNLNIGEMDLKYRRNISAIRIA